MKHASRLMEIRRDQRTQKEWETNVKAHGERSSTLGVLEDRKKKKKAEIILEETMAKIFPKLMCVTGTMSRAG